MSWSIAEGNREEGYGLFLGLAKDPAIRHRLKDAILFSGIIDLQDTIINRGGYQNIGHKALRARALIDIADFLGWDNAHEVIYTVVPDLGCCPSSARTLERDRQYLPDGVRTHDSIPSAPATR